MNSLPEDITNLISKYLVHSERQLLQIQPIKTHGTLTGLFKKYDNGSETLRNLLKVVDLCGCILTGNTIRTLYYKYLRQDDDIDHVKLDFDIIAPNKNKFMTCWQLLIDQNFDFGNTNEDDGLLYQKYYGHTCIQLTLNGFLKCNLIILNGFTLWTRDVFLDKYMLNINRVYIMNSKTFIHPEAKNATLNRDLISLGVDSHNIYDLLNYQLLQIENVNDKVLAYYEQLSCKPCKLKYKNPKYSSSDFKKLRCLRCSRLEYCDNLLSKVNCDKEQVCSNILEYLMRDLGLKLHEEAFKDTENPVDRKSDIENNCETIRRLITRIEMQYTEMYKHD